MRMASYFTFRWLWSNYIRLSVFCSMDKAATDWTMNIPICDENWWQYSICPSFCLRQNSSQILIKTKTAPQYFYAQRVRGSIENFDDFSLFCVGEENKRYLNPISLLNSVPDLQTVNIWTKRDYRRPYSFPDFETSRKPFSNVYLPGWAGQSMAKAA